MATISDKKIGNDGGDGTIDYFTADVVTANDYYPFGMLMPGRKYSIGSSYRYGFNGKENDNDVKGEGNQQDYGLRIYDGRLGKFLSMDPLTKKFPFYSPYHYAGNSPIKNIDLDGAEPAGNRWDWEVLQSGKSYMAAHKLNDGTTVFARAEQQLVKDKAGWKGWITHMTWFESSHGLTSKANYFSWFNPDPNSGLHPKSEQRWETFETNVMTRQRQVRENAKNLQIGIFGAAAAGSSLPLALTAFGTERGISVGVDYISQVGGNYLAGKSGWDLVTEVNLTSLAVAAINPTSTWKGLITNNLVSNTFSISAQSGKYDGLGQSKGLETVLLQTALSTFAGKATSRLDIGIDKMKIRLNHVNRLEGNGELSAALQSTIRKYQGRAAAVNTATAIPSEGVNNKLDKGN